MNRLTLGEKKEILDFRIRNPEKSHKKMADYFRIKLGKKVDYSHIYRIMKDQAKIQQAAAHKNFKF